jgi:predicted O-methyltransferase YrrM
VHIHAPEEKSHLYHALDDNSTEVEVLNFINAAVICLKPNRVIETGTFLGFGSIAILDAMINNGFGFLHSLEYKLDRIEDAKKNIKKYFGEGFSAPLNADHQNYTDYCEIIHKSSIDFINNYKANKPTDKFDFGFFDSQLAMRHLEFQAMADQGLLNKGFVAIFHDTSRLRPLYLPDYSSPEMIEGLDKLSLGKEWMEFPNSRGFRMLRWS